MTICRDSTEWGLVAEQCVCQEREQTCPYSSLTLVLPAREVRCRVERGQFTPVLNMEETGPSKPDEMVR